MRLYALDTPQILDFVIRKALVEYLSQFLTDAISNFFCVQPKSVKTTNFLRLSWSLICSILTKPCSTNFFIMLVNVLLASPLLEQYQLQLPSLLFCHKTVKIFPVHFCIEHLVPCSSFERYAHSTSVSVKLGIPLSCPFLSLLFLYRNITVINTVRYICQLFRYRNNIKIKTFLIIKESSNYNRLIALKYFIQPCNIFIASHRH